MNELMRELRVVAKIEYYDPDGYLVAEVWVLPNGEKRIIGDPRAVIPISV